MLMDIKEDNLNELLTVNPLYDPATKTLHVNKDLQGDPKWHARVTAAVLFRLRFQKFSDTRWAAVGARLRMLTLALSVGLERMVELVVADEDAYGYHIGGFKKLEERGVRVYIAIAAVASLPLERVSLKLMYDDRFFCGPPH